LAGVDAEPHRTEDRHRGAQLVEVARVNLGEAEGLHPTDADLDMPTLTSDSHATCMSMPLSSVGKFGFWVL
jgi:hypothetical protein